MSHYFNSEPSFKDLTLTFCSFASLLVFLQVQKWCFLNLLPCVHLALFCVEISPQFGLLSSRQYSSIWASKMAYKRSICFQMQGHFVIFVGPSRTLLPVLGWFKKLFLRNLFAFQFFLPYLVLWTKNMVDCARICPL